MLTYRIESADHGRRVDSFLRNLLPKAPFSYLKKLLSAGHLTVNGASPQGTTQLRLADQVCLKESAKTASFLREKPPTQDILFEDSWIVAFNKRSGLAVHRTEDAAEANLVELGERFLGIRGETVKLRPVNRLDKGTSGAIILAKNAVAAGMFGRMVKEEGLGKIYLALVQGKLPQEGVIDAPLEGKESQTGYLRLLQGRDGAFVAVYPVTGRMHQIRQHFRMIGHPILGDKRYGGREISGFNGHALHSFETRLIHPATGEEIVIPAPFPDPFFRLAEAITGTHGAELMQVLDQIPSELLPGPTT